MRAGKHDSFSFEEEDDDVVVVDEDFVDLIEGFDSLSTSDFSFENLKNDAICVRISSD